MTSRLILILILIGFIVLFIIQNVKVVEIRFLVWSIQMSRSLLVFIVLGTGILTGWVLRGYFLSKKKFNHLEAK